MVVGGGGVEVTETAVILNLEWVKFCLGMRVEKGCVYKNAYISATVGRKILKKYVWVANYLG